MRAPLNRTLTLSDAEFEHYKTELRQLDSPAAKAEVYDRVFCQDVFEVLPKLPDRSVDLMFADPPYNLTKSFNDTTFRETSVDEYAEWLDSWLAQTVRILKPTASVYICSDWRSSAATRLIVTTRRKRRTSRRLATRCIRVSNASSDSSLKLCSSQLPRNSRRSRNNYRARTSPSLLPIHTIWKASFVRSKQLG